MALVGVRQIASARGGSPLCVFLVDAAADRPAASSCAAGDRAFGLSGGDDGTAWEVQRYSGGLRWVDVTPGARVWSPEDDDATTLGDASHAFRSVYLGTAVEATGNLTINIPDSVGRTQLSVVNQASGVSAFCDLYADGTLIFSNGGGALNAYSFAGVPTAPRVITWPDASGTVVFAATAQTLTAKTWSRCIASPATVAAIGALSSPSEGEVAYASDGRKPGEAIASGTGVLAFYDGSAWISACDGAALAA